MVGDLGVGAAVDRQVLAEALGAGAAVDAEHRLDLEPVPRVVGQARRFVAEHVPNLPPDSYDALMLATSELVTNAVIHARTPLTVGVTLSGPRVLVTVFDQDLGRRELGGHDRDGGRGLELVRALADASDTTVHHYGGKTAWFVVGGPAAGGTEGP